jgi:surfeit locus 1 family protein
MNSFGRNCMRFVSAVRIPRRSVAYAYVKRTTSEWSTNSKLALLTLPAITFGLGTWQVFRLREKEEMIAKREHRINADVVELPSSLQFNDDELVALSKELEYRRVHLRGKFLPDSDMHLTPRVNADHQNGFQVITPLRRESDGAVVLVNRGWMPTAIRMKPERLSHFLPRGTVDIIGYVRLSDRPSMFVPRTNSEKNLWFSVDIPHMAAMAGHNALPILIDVKEITPVAELPEVGQTRVTLPNNHMQYIATWYSLTGFLLIFARGLFRK